MSEKINVEMTVEELRTTVSVLEGNPLHFRNLAHQKSGNGSATHEALVQRQLADRLSLELAKHALVKHAS